MQYLSLFEGDSTLLTLDNKLTSFFDDNFRNKINRFSSITYTKSYTLISGCVLEHVLTTTNLTNLEKIYYLLADSLSIINKNKGGSRSCALPSKEWAKRLGCSRSLVFEMQRSLVQKGYFIISKDFDTKGRNKRNLITPTIPSHVFSHLNERFPGRVGEYYPYNPLLECRRSYLDRTKLFIKFNYNLLKLITSSKDLNPQQKVIWLGCYANAYKFFMMQSKNNFNYDNYGNREDCSFSFITSY
jgi:DNA-binding MarR family transcriptional regulator